MHLCKSDVISCGTHALRNDLNVGHVRMHCVRRLVDCHVNTSMPGFHYEPRARATDMHNLMQTYLTP